MTRIYGAQDSRSHSLMQVFIKSTVRNLNMRFPAFGGLIFKTEIQNVFLRLFDMSGSNLNHDAGYLDFGRTGSLELIVLTDEIISQVRRLSQGVPVDEETLAFEAFRDVGYKGEFLTHDHTVKLVRSVQWQPQLISRKAFEDWGAAGSRSFIDRADQRLEEILKTHTNLKLSKEKLQAI